MTSDERWMHIAIQEAKIGQIEGEVPVGAILVKDEILISQAHNQPIIKNDPTAHAEIQAIRNAGKIQKNYRLVGSTLYVTLEPCLMCFGAIVNARIERLVFGAFDYKNGVSSSLKKNSSEIIFNHNVLIEGGILKDETKEILQSFFKSIRKR
jgi:tRNA(adenine34) deaminase